MDPAYREYCRCWWLFLDRIDRDEAFTIRLMTALHRSQPDVCVSVWPKVWPNVEYLFETAPGTGRENFVSAVRFAEKRPEGERWSERPCD